MRRADVLAGLGAAPALVAVTLSQGSAASPQTLAQFQAADAIGQAHLETFDDLDFNVFTHQEWSRVHESHAHDVLVHWPDGHATTGIERHIADMQAIFAYAPDTSIKEHPVKIQMGAWTSVIGVMQGTFTQPLVTPNGSIPPTGKPFKIAMCTVGHWTDGVMDEEFLFWDNGAFAKQMGLS